jgi:hypothetical protein
MKRTLIAISIVALLGATPAIAQVDLSRYVALGDATTAGLTNGGLMDCYQLNSWPKVLADQAGVGDEFEMPLISTPGLPQLFQLVGIDVIAGQLVPTIVRVGLEPGNPDNALLPRPYNNLAVPGATLFNLLFTTGDITNLLAGNFDNAMHDIILRFPADPGTGQPTPAIAQAIGLDPTLVTVWIGNDDVLPSVLTGSPIEGLTMTPVSLFAEMYPQAVGALVSLTSADIVLMTVFDVTEAPLATTLPPLLEVPGVGITPIIGSNGPLSLDSRVTLPASELLAQGYGLPLPGSPPLPEDLNLATGEPGYVLRPAEIQTIKDQVAAYNQIIRDTAAAFGLPVFDAGGIMDRANVGEGWTFASLVFDSEFLLGGVIGFDGLYKQQIGHWIFAMELIDFLNAEMGADIDTVNMNDILFFNPCAAPPEVKATGDNVVFSKAAHQQLLDILVPQLKQLSEPDEPAERELPEPIRSHPRARRRLP